MDRQWRRQAFVLPAMSSGVISAMTSNGGRLLKHSKKNMKATKQQMANNKNSGNNNDDNEQWVATNESCGVIGRASNVVVGVGGR